LHLIASFIRSADQPGWSEFGDEKPITLSLHIGVGCGAMTLMHLGGHHSRLEYVVAGKAISEAASAEPHAVSGETVVSINCISSLKFANDAPPRGWIGSFSLEEGAMLLSGVFG
jgi:class 3 adenylate cyclase